MKVLWLNCVNKKLDAAEVTCKEHLPFTHDLYGYAGSKNMPQDLKSNLISTNSCSVYLNLLEETSRYVWQ